MKLLVSKNVDIKGWLSGGGDTGSGTYWYKVGISFFATPVASIYNGCLNILLFKNTNDFMLLIILQKYRYALKTQIL